MVARGLLGHEQEFLDSLHVMEEGMRHFYGEADEPARRGDRIAGCDVASWHKASISHVRCDFCCRG
jgi:hypothetical protein